MNSMLKFKQSLICLAKIHNTFHLFFDSLTHTLTTLCQSINQSLLQAQNRNSLFVHYIQRNIGGFKPF